MEEEYEGDIIVTLPSGAPYPVLTEDEQTHVEQQIGSYTTAFAFTNVSDIADLDRVLIMELLCYRIGVWLGRGADYEGNTQLDEDKLRDSMNKMNHQLRLLKKQMGIDKATRDRTRGEGSLHQYVQTLLARAKLFGYHREEQLDKALELMNQFIGLLTRHKQATPEEQREFRCSADDLIEWAWEVMKPEYEAVDEHFRHNVQKYWAQELPM